MAFVVRDRIQETTSTTGTGNLVLGGAVAGFKTFSSVMSNGDTTYYSCVNASGSEWEVGAGTYVSGSNAIARNTIFASSTGGTVSFTAGTKNIFITYAAPRAMATNMMSGTGGLLSRDGTGNPYDVAIGSTGQVLTVNGSGYPGWASPAVGTAFTSSDTTNYISQYYPVSLNRTGQVELTTSFSPSNSGGFSNSQFGNTQGESYTTADGTPVYVWSLTYADIVGQVGRVNGSGTTSYYGWASTGSYYSTQSVTTTTTYSQWVSVAWDPKTDYGVALFCDSSSNLYISNFLADTNGLSGSQGSISTKGQYTIKTDCNVTGPKGFKGSIVYDPYSDTMLVAYVDTSGNVKVVAIGRSGTWWQNVTATVTVGTITASGGSICGAFDYQNGGAAFAMVNSGASTVQFFAAKGDINSINYSVGGSYGATAIIYSGLSDSIGTTSSAFPLSNQSWAFNKRLRGLIFFTKLSAQTRPTYQLVRSNGGSVTYSSPIDTIYTAINNYDTCVVISGQEDYGVLITLDDGTGTVSYVPFDVSLGGDIITSSPTAFPAFSGGASPGSGVGLGAVYGPKNQARPIYTALFSSSAGGDAYLNVTHSNITSFIGFSQSAVGASTATTVVTSVGLSTTNSSSLTPGQTYYLGVLMGAVSLYPNAYVSGSAGNNILVGPAQSTTQILVTNSPGFSLLSLPYTPPPVSFRNIPPVGTKTASYTLTVNDVGKYVQVGTGGSITIPTSTFSEGDAVTIANNTTGNITITCSAPTSYIAGTNTVKTTMTLATRGVATVFFISSTVCFVTGNVT